MEIPLFSPPRKHSSKSHLQTQIQLSLDIFHPRPAGRDGREQGLGDLAMSEKLWQKKEKGYPKIAGEWLFIFLQICFFTVRGFDHVWPIPTCKKWEFDQQRRFDHRKLGIDPAKMEHVITKMYLTFSGQMYNDLCISNTERNLQIAWRVDLKLLFVRSFLSQVGLWFLNMVEQWGMTILVETNHDPLVSGILKDDSIQLACTCLCV